MFVQVLLKINVLFTVFLPVCKVFLVTGKYPVWAYMHSYTRGKPTGAVEAFLNYLMTDDVQKNIVPQLGYIPGTEMKIVRDAKGNVNNK